MWAWLKSFWEYKPHTCGMCGDAITKENVVYLPISVGNNKSLEGPLCQSCEEDFFND